MRELRTYLHVLSCTMGPGKRGEKKQKSFIGAFRLLSAPLFFLMWLGSIEARGVTATPSQLPADSSRTQASG